MDIARLIFAFVIGLTVSVATQKYITYSATKLGRNGKVNDNAVRLACMLGQAASVLVLVLFRFSMGTLLSAGIGLLVPKNIMIIRGIVTRKRS